MKNQIIAIAAGLIIVVVTLGGFTIHNIQMKLTKKESMIDDLENSVRELEMEVQSLIASNEEYNRRCSENEELVQALEENVQALDEELVISRNYATILESRLRSLILQVINSTKPPQVIPRRPMFYIGEIISFKIMYDYPLYSSSIKVWNPDGVLVWETDPFVEWEQLTDGTWRVPYYFQVIDENPILLEEDMPIGNYTWSFVYGDVLDIRGEFSVLVYET